MSNYIFTNKAEVDLADIVDFTVDRWGVEKTYKYIDGLEEMTQMLANNPDIGIKRDKVIEGLLCFPYESHLIYYLKENLAKQADKIAIIRVLHQSMEPKKYISNK